MHKINSLSPKYIKEKGQDRQSITMTKVTTRAEIDLIVVTEEWHLEIEVEVDLHKIMDKITERIMEGDHKTITEMTLGEEIIERHKIIEVRIY